MGDLFVHKIIMVGTGGVGKEFLIFKNFLTDLFDTYTNYNYSFNPGKSALTLQVKFHVFDFVILVSFNFVYYVSQSICMMIS